MSAVYPGTGVRHWSERIQTSLVIPFGVLGGLLLGVIARAWMRWISTDPEFTMGGTIGIIVGFVLFFTAHATVLFGKRKDWSRAWLTVTRVGAIIFSLGIFVAAGAMMFPTVLAVTLATGRTDWPRQLRRVIFVLGLIIPGFVAKGIGSDFGWGLTTVGRILLFMLVYSVVIAAARVTAMPLKDSRPIVPKPLGRSRPSRVKVDAAGERAKHGTPLSDLVSDGR